MDAEPAEAREHRRDAVIGAAHEIRGVGRKLGDGLGQAATWNIRERYRPEGERSARYQAYYERTIGRSFAALEAEASALAARFGIGEISIACAISYVDFRYPDRGWRKAAPNLGAWYDSVRERESMRATELQPYKGPLQPAA